MNSSLIMISITNFAAKMAAPTEVKEEETTTDQVLIDHS